MDIFVFSDLFGSFRPKDKEYHCHDGEYIRRPDGAIFLVIIETNKKRIKKIKPTEMLNDVSVIELVRNV